MAFTMLSISLTAIFSASTSDCVISRITPSFEFATTLGRMASTETKSENFMVFCIYSDEISFFGLFQHFYDHVVFLYASAIAAQAFAPRHQHYARDWLRSHD